MKTTKQILLLAIALVCSIGLNAQSDTETLFTVADEPVTVGEFRYIYSKTNGDAADFSKEGVMEYLELYQRFKLKVARAKAMGLDTVKVLQNELAGYRRQLADNYLIEKQVTDPLVEELYRRQQSDIEFSHILFPFSGNPTERDRQAVLASAQEAMKTISPSNFADKASELSGDTYSKDKGGRIGFVSAPFPRGLHNLEDALFAAKDNTVIGPVRSAAGYHLLLKEGSRAARGEMEVAHILVRKSAGDGGNLPAKIQNAKKALDDGEDFGKVAMLFSDDKKTARNEGYLGFFEINRYEPTFENAAFALEADGDVSDIVETSAGYHLIKRISRKGVQPLSDLRPLLEKKVKADGRFADAKQQMLVDLREKFNVSTDEALFGRFAATLEDSTFLDFKWTPSSSAEKGALVKYGDGTSLSLDNLQAYYQKNNRKRVSLGRGSNSFTVAKKLFEEWADAELLSYAESRLEKDYYGFAALMREYREGILLFEATKIEVWDKASEDTLGLQKFFAANRDDYRFEERAEVTTYQLNVKAGLNAQEVYAFAEANGKDATTEKFGSSLTARSSTISKTEASQLGLTKCRAGERTDVANDVKKGLATFSKIEAVLPARQKELKEARGYVIADFQDQLEREWVEELRQQFPVKVNKKVLNKMIR